MRWNPIRNLVAILIILIVVAASLVTIQNLSQTQASSSLAAMNDLHAYGSFVPMSNQAAPLVRQARYVRPTRSDQPLAITVGLQPRNLNDLNDLVLAVRNPASPLYRHFLTPAQFKERFAPTTDQVQQVTQFLQSQGLSVKNVASNNLLIDVAGTVSQVQQAFKVQINDYQLGKQTFYANATQPQIPGKLHAFVSSLSGLDSSVRFQAHHVVRSGAQGTTGGFGPKDLATAYDFAPLQNSNIYGDNQSIALLELDGYQLNDVQQYANIYNLGGTGTINASNVLVDGFSGAAGSNAVEVELDMEVTAAVAPHALQLVYEGPNTAQGFNDTVNRIVTDNRTSIVSISWGACESVTGSANMQTLSNIFAQGAVQGMSFFAASGDSGAYGCQDTNLAVDYPASDPNVTAVGGTTLNVNPDGTYGSESVWSNPLDILHGPKGAGSGGGISSVWPRPGWQSGPGVQNAYSNGNREVPDISVDADPNTGYAIYCTVSLAGCLTSGWLHIGGTSASAPLLAASTALINQYLLAQGKSPLGLVNPLLYALYNGQQAYPAYHSITAGNNLYYPATGTYSMATGLGSPDVFNMARDLVMGDLLAQDTFRRANQTFWGTASDGHVWQGDASNNSAFSIVSNTGQISGNGAYNTLLGPVVQNAEIVMTSSLTDFTGSSIGALLHWVDANNWYKAGLTGSALVLQKKVNGMTLMLGSVPFTASPNTAYTMRFRMVNSTLSVKVWVAGQPEPTAWQLSVADNSFQTGSCGLRTLLQSGAVQTITSFQVTAVQ
ncbi:MAG TPA: S53 family peptidase [Ktedonobacteraceae bacterium]|nr:S53 family peptidase [Ktedonobacteraceae bacterium]